MTGSKKLILLTSGPIAVGKSQIVSSLVNKYGFSKLSSGSYLKSLAVSQGLDVNRASLTEIGDNLDKETDYSWVVSKVTKSALEESPSTNRWVFDSVRKKKQVQHFRNAYPESIIHIHFFAEEEVLNSRFDKR